MRRVQIPSLQRSLLTRPQRGVRFLRRRALDDARSDLVLQETALFLYQLQYDSRMQQAMLFDSFDVAQKLRAQRDEVRDVTSPYTAAWTAGGCPVGEIPDGERANVWSDATVDGVYGSDDNRPPIAQCLESSSRRGAVPLRPWKEKGVSLV